MGKTAAPYQFPFSANWGIITVDKNEALWEIALKGGKTKTSAQQLSGCFLSGSAFPARVSQLSLPGDHARTAPNRGI